MLQVVLDEILTQQIEFNLEFLFQSVWQLIAFMTARRVKCQRFETQLKSRGNQCGVYQKDGAFEDAAVASL